MIDLLFTAANMCSNDYRDRFFAEYSQLSIRHAKLSQMLEKWDAGELTFDPTCPRPLYERQLSAMADYKSVLEARAKIEGINLQEHMENLDIYADAVKQDNAVYNASKLYVRNAPHMPIIWEQ